MTINSKSSKAEILAAYKDLEKQQKILEAKIKQQDKGSLAANSPAVSTIKPEAEAEKGQNTNPDLARTIQSLEKIQGSFGGAVNNLSEQLIAEAMELEAVKIAIAAETQDLENLYQLTDIDESTIDFLLDQYQASSQKFTVEYEQQQGTDRQELDEILILQQREKQNYQLRIESLEQTIKHQASRVEKLSLQLDSSLQQVQNLAVKAIDGKSNRNSLEGVKAIAMEQGKTPQKGK